MKAHGRRYKVTRPTDPEGVAPDREASVSHQTSLESLASRNQSKVTIYTDHGSSDSEGEGPTAETSYVQYVSARSRADPSSRPDTALPEADEVVQEESESQDWELRGEGGLEESVSRWSFAKLERKPGGVSFTLLAVSIHDRPLSCELKFGDEIQRFEEVSAARWPQTLPARTFEVEDLRVPRTLKLSFWTSQDPSGSGFGGSGHPHCMASGHLELELSAAPKRSQVQVSLKVQDQNQLRRGLALLQLEVSPQKPQLVVYGHGDALCSRSLSLFRRFKRRMQHTQDEELEAMEGYEDRPLDEDARCWSYLEHRFEALKLKRQQERQLISRAAALKACPSTDLETPRSLARVSSEQAMRLQRFLRPIVRGTHGSKVLAEHVEPSTFQAESFREFLESSLRAPRLPQDDWAALSALLCADGEVQMQDFLNFVEHGVEVVPVPRVIYPDEQRAREILREMFPNFLAKELQREMKVGEKAFC